LSQTRAPTQGWTFQLTCSVALALSLTTPLGSVIWYLGFWFFSEITPGVVDVVLEDCPLESLLLFAVDFGFPGKYRALRFCQENGVGVGGMMVSHMTASDIPT